MLPLAPLLVVSRCCSNGGYLSTFVAAGGQTIGKMAAGIRVIPADPAAPASRARDASASGRPRRRRTRRPPLPLGLGIRSRRSSARSVAALHDRLADTRVVKA